MKSAELKNLSTEELNNKLVESKAKLNELSLTNAVSPLENPMEIRFVRRNVARIMTELHSR